MVFLANKHSRVLVGIASLCVAATLLTSCGFKRKKYENPISKDTQQPDKVLFDKSISDIEHGRYEVARLTLNTLINTYDTSEYLAKAKLAVADSWFREGGTHGLAQAEAEYKDFILFYPQMEEAAESQWKVCQIHYKQMEKADRDPTQAQRAEDECRQVLVQFPNSKFVDRAKQMLRDTQEVLADKEFKTGTFYVSRQAFPAAANRLSYVVDQYPLYSAADEALWELAYSYQKLGDRWEDKAAEAYTRLVKEYPLSPHAEEAADKLTAMKRPVPAADPAAVARMKYEAEHHPRPSITSRVMAPAKELIFHGPDTRASAKSGDPSMETRRPPTPISVPGAPTAAPTGGTVSGTVSATQVVNDTTNIDSKPDARSAGAPGPAGTANGGTGGLPAAGTTATGTSAAASTVAGQAATPAAPAPPPTNYQTIKVKPPKVKKPKKQKNPPAAAAPATATAPAGAPAGTAAPATTATPK